MTSLVEHCSPRSSFSWLPERRFFFWWKAPLIAVSTPALYPICHVNLAWEERLSGLTVGVSPFSSNSSKCHLQRWTYDYAQSRASLSESCTVWSDATGEIVTWERCRRSQENTSVTLSPMLLLKHLPREGILFSSTTPVKVSDPVITCMLPLHTDKEQTCMQYPQDSVDSCPVLPTQSRYINHMLAGQYSNWQMPYYC